MNRRDSMRWTIPSACDRVRSKTIHRLLSERKQLFGTDGIRGIANADLAPELAMDIGRAAGEVFQAKRVVVAGKTENLEGCWHYRFKQVCTPLEIRFGFQLQL